jgi:hypothetical protein
LRRNMFMPTKKKTTESDAAAPAPAAETRKPAARAKSPAATHKSPAKKTTRLTFRAEEHHEEIAREAYYLWVDRGHAHGKAMDDWLQAVETVKARRKTEASAN